LEYFEKRKKMKKRQQVEDEKIKEIAVWLNKKVQKTKLHQVIEEE